MFHYVREATPEADGVTLGVGWLTTTAVQDLPPEGYRAATAEEIEALEAAALLEDDELLGGR